MKKNDLAEVKKLDIKTINERAKKIKEELFGLVIDKNMNKMTNLKVIKSKRKDRAQLLTVLKQKQLVAVLEK